jgi:hypothetical protein
MLSGVALMAKVLSAGKMAGAGLHKVRALYVAEAGIERARWRLGLENDLTVVPPPDNLYTDELFGGGEYTVALSERTLTEATMTSSGTYGAITRTIQARIRLNTQWWDPAWRYRRPVTVTNSTASDLTDYQVRVVIPFGAGKMNADYSDLRFLDESDTELSYWIEAGDATSAVVWVKVGQIPASGQATVMAYYGNTAASPASDISTTMEPDYIKYDVPATWTDRTSTTSIASGDNVGAWIDPLPFTFPYYQGTETRVYACSNGYLSFGNDYNNDRKNNSNKLEGRRMIAALWDDLRTDTIYDICDEPGIYVDSYTDYVLIDWEAYRRGFLFFNAAALFQVTLYRSGDILLSRGDTTNDLLISETVGISDGDGLFTDITSESQPNRSWLFAMRKYVSPEPTVALGTEETCSRTVLIYWKEQ